MGILDKIKPGVVTGKDLQTLFDYCKEKAFALPAVNCVGTDSVNAAMEAAKAANSPIIIQFSNGGGTFYAGKGLKLDGQETAVLGSVSAAKHVHMLAEKYGVGGWNAGSWGKVFQRNRKTSF